MKTVQELRTLQKLAEEYQQLGYTVTVEPPAALIPSSLGNYRPEILATKDGVSLLFDVKLEGARDIDAFSMVAGEIKRHPCWKLWVVTVPNVDPDVNTSGILSDLDVDGLRQHLHDTDALSRDSRSVPIAFTRLWIVYIAALRLLASQEGCDRDGDTDLYRLDRAASNGLISNAEFEEARALLALRNRIVDGKDAVVAHEDCLQLRQMIQRVIDQVAPVEASETVRSVEV